MTRGDTYTRDEQLLAVLTDRQLAAEIRDRQRVRDMARADLRQAYARVQVATRDLNRASDVAYQRALDDAPVPAALAIMVADHYGDATVRANTILTSSARTHLPADVVAGVHIHHDPATPDDSVYVTVILQRPVTDTPTQWHNRVPGILDGLQSLAADWRRYQQMPDRICVCVDGGEPIDGVADRYLLELDPATLTADATLRIDRSPSDDHHPADITGHALHLLAAIPVSTDELTPLP